MFVAPDQVLHFSWVIIIIAFLWSKFCEYKLQAKGFIITLLLFVTFVGVGFFRTNQFHHRYSFTDFDRYNNQMITIVGTINQAPTFKSGTQLVRVHPESIDGDKVSKTSRDIIMRFSDTASFSVGDRVVASGTFLARADFQSDTGRVVRYRLMSYSRKIAGDITYPQLVSTVHSNHNILQVFSNVKNKFLFTLNTLFVSPASGLLSGIIIGDTSNVDRDLLDIFRAVGLIHIVVLSGYNITLVANFFIRMFAPLGYYRRLITAMIALVFFVLIVGISPTAMRAGIMALCAFAARYYLRPYMVTRGIALTLLIMVWISPYSLLFDLSLQLSFLATIGIIYVFPILSERFEKLSENTFGEILLQTLAVNMLTLPIIIYQMGYFSFISFPVNVLVLACIPWLTIGGFFAVFAGMVTGFLGKIIAFPIQIITDGIIKVATWTAYHDPFRLSFQPFSLYWILVVYGMMFSWLLFRDRIVRNND